MKKQPAILAIFVNRNRAYSFLYFESRRISKNMIAAIQKVFKEKTYFAIFTLTSAIFLVLFIITPMVAIPGNDLMFQLKIFSTRDYLLMAFLAMLVGLNLALGIYNSRNKLVKQKLSQTVAQCILSGISGIFGAVVGSAACALCLAALFGLIGLGTGSAFFVLKNQSYFLLGAVALMLISLYFAARKVNKVCGSC